MPSLDKLNREWKSRGLVVLGISDEDAETLKKFYAKNQLGFPTLIDTGRRVRRHYGEQGGVPVSIVLDRKGRVVARVDGTRSVAGFERLFQQAGLARR